MKIEDTTDPCWFERLNSDVVAKAGRIVRFVKFYRKCAGSECVLISGSQVRALLGSPLTPMTYGRYERCRFSSLITVSPSTD